LIDALVFDIGGVLIDYNPMFLYRDHFDSYEAAKYFIESTFTSDWNEKIECSKSLKLGVQELANRKEKHLSCCIKLFDINWISMTRAKKDTLNIFNKLAKYYPMYGLTNLAGDRIQIINKAYEFTRLFEEIIISGELGIRKPDKRIFEHLIMKTQREPHRLLFFDDNKANISAAEKLGINVLHFSSSEQLQCDLKNLGIKF